MPPDPSCSTPLGIIGGGAWGRALAVHAQRAGQDVRVWTRSAQTDLAPCGLVLVALPVAHARAVVLRLGLAGHRLLFACKGIAPDGCFPAEGFARAGVLSGPNFAHEIAAGLPAASVVATPNEALRAEAVARLATRDFRLYPSDDLIGAMAGGAAKNVIAIAAGACIGAGLGENARAALVTRGVAEIGRFAVASGGRAETVAGLSGMGDLILTCTGAASRNYSFGLALGRGMPVADALAAASGVVEGAPTAAALVRRARAVGVEMPICEAVAAVVGGTATLRDAMDRLLARPVRAE